MKRIAWFGLLLAASAQGAAAQPADTLNDQQKIGRQVFAQSCGVCHLPPSMGAKTYGPALNKEAGGGDGIVVHAVRGKLGELEKRRSRIEQRAHSLARQQLAASGMAFPRHRTAALLDFGDTGFEVRDQGAERVTVAREGGTAGVEAGFNDGHDSIFGLGIRAAT